MKHNHEVALTPRTKRLWELRKRMLEPSQEYPHWTEFADNRYPGTLDDLQRRQFFKQFKAGVHEARSQRRS